MSAENIEQAASARETLTKAGSHVVNLTAGLADLVLTEMTTLLGAMRRSDLTEVVTEGHESLVTRGKLALARHGATAVPHMELLARRVAERHGDA